MGFEPTTPTLARLCSTPELRPRWCDPYHEGGGGLQGPAQGPALGAAQVARSGALRCVPPPTIVAAMPDAPFTPDQLFARLDTLGIAYRTHHHPAVFTVADAVALRGELPGGHCKSLFLKDKKGGLWLVVALEERRIDLKRLAGVLAAPRFSFGAPDLLYEVLGVRPGSVTPFALVNDAAGRVTVVLDRGMLEHDPLNYHPLENDRTTAIAAGDLLRFIAACGHRPRIVELD
jgi:Ala-tRNA(Pro) deacylase